MSTSKGLEYLDEDGTGLEAMVPTQETPEENKFKRNLQLCYMNDESTHIITHILTFIKK